MSFRHTYLTDFIYDAGIGWKERRKKIKKILEVQSRQPDNNSGTIIGYLSGVIGSGYPDEPFVNQWFEEIIRELEKITEVPFRLTFMCESGPVVTYTVEPMKKDMK